MESCDLLARENEFRKLNKQLEKKTKSLMKEIEFVMQKQDIFTDFSQNVSSRLKPKENIKKHFCDSPITTPERLSSVKKSLKTSNNLQHDPNTVNNKSYNGSSKPNNPEKSNNISQEPKNNENIRIMCECCNVKEKKPDLDFLYAFVSVSVNEKILPEFFLKGEVSIETVCKCLSSKIKLLQEQIEKLQANIRKKETQCEQHLTKLAEFEDERLTLLNRSNNLNATATDIRTKYAALQHRLEEKDRLYKEQRSETDKLSSEVKRLRSRNANVEAKCATSQEIIDNLTQQVQLAKRQEKEIKDTNRSMAAAQQTTISNLESRVKRLTARIDKQTALIDNLKRQNALLCTDGALKALEKEYNSFLSQDF